MNEKFKKTLATFREKLENTDIEWAIIGDTNLYLHGMDVEPEDIDIATDPEGIEKMEVIFSDWIDRPVERKKPFEEYPEFYELKLKMNGFEIEIMGEKEGSYFEKIRRGRVEQVNFEGLKIPCLTLEAEMDSYRETNRGWVAEKVEKYLESSNSR